MLVGQRAKNKRLTRKSLSIYASLPEFLQVTVYNRVWSSLHNYRQVDTTTLTLDYAT